MRYRLETKDEQLVIVNVEADAVAGTLQPVKLFNPQTGSYYDSYDVLGLDGSVLTTLLSAGGTVNLSNALDAVYWYDQYYGFPSVRSCKLEPDRLRVEQRLGALVAQIGSAFILAQQYPECLTAANDRAAALAELRELCSVSQHGSFDSERRVFEPYFVNVGSKPRLAFYEAIDVWGWIEIHAQFSELSEYVQRRALQQAYADIARHIGLDSSYKLHLAA